jgi:hypothetical protein
MRTCRYPASLIGFVIVALGALLEMGANTALSADPTGKIVELAPCDMHPIKGDVKEAADKLKRVMKLKENDEVFVAAADVTSVADGSKFVLTLDVATPANVVLQTVVRKQVDSGKSATLVAYVGVDDCVGKCHLKATIGLEGGAALDRKACVYTCTKGTERSEVTLRGIEQLSVGKDAQQKIADQIEAEAKRSAAGATLQTARVTSYLLIDFGFSGDYFYPNSVQFYGPSGFLCSKVVDNNSLASLVPILNCQSVYVTWDTTTKLAVHVMGAQPKP